MILKKVTLHNYGLFQGEHAIEFAQPSIQRVTLVGGLNGSGKTTIFEAIQICYLELSPTSIKKAHPQVASLIINFFYQKLIGM